MKVPELYGRVHGEECAVFSNAVGETITVQVLETEAATAELLTQVTAIQCINVMCG